MMRKEGIIFGRAFGLLLALTIGLVWVTSAAVAQPASDTVWRITVADGLSEAAARDYKSELEKMGFLPINLDFEVNPVTVRYGNFSTREEAMEARDRLEAQGFGAREVVQVTRGGLAPAAEESYRVRVNSFEDAAAAEALDQELENKGFVYVDTVFENGRHHVYAGRYDNRNDAQNLLSILRDQGYTQAEMIDPQREELDLGGDMPAPAGISPVITDTGLWRQLSEDQKRRVIDTVLMQEEIRSGNFAAQKLIDLERRIEGLDEKSRQIVEMIQADRESEAAKTRQIGTLFRDAENLARGKQYEKALIKFRQILQIDPNNQTAQRRIALIENFLQTGERYEGQSEELQARYAQLKEEANRLAGTNEMASLREARNLWLMIKNLDPDNPERFAEEASAEINKITNRIVQIEEQEQQVAAAAQAAERRQMLYIFAALGLLIVLFLIATFFLVKHQVMMNEIRAVANAGPRPMRELEGSGSAGHIAQGAPVGALAGAVAGAGVGAAAGAGSKKAEKSEGRSGGFFGRRKGKKDAEATSDEQVEDDSVLGDPLAVQTSAGEPEAEEDIFAGEGGEPEAEPAGAAAGGEDEHGPLTMAMNMDSDGAPPATEDSSFTQMFEQEAESPEEEPATAPPIPESKAQSAPAPKPAPAAAEPEAEPVAESQGGGGETDFDDIFSDLPSLGETNAPEPASETAFEESGTGSAVDLNMDDLFGDSQTNAPMEAEQETGSAISFDDIVAAETGAEGSEEPKQAAAAGVAPNAASQPEGGTEDPFAGTPFEDIFGDTNADGSGAGETITEEAPSERSKAAAAGAAGASAGAAAGAAAESEPDREQSPVATETEEPAGRSGDDTEIPSLDFEIPDEDPFASPKGTIQAEEVEAPSEPEPVSPVAEPEPEPAAAGAESANQSAGADSFEGEDPFADLSFDETIPEAEEETAETPAVETAGAAGAASAGAASAASGATPKVAAGDDPTAVPPETGGGAKVIYAQDFSGAGVGTKPEGWNGEYDYATLSVMDADPPQGAKKYLAYSKKEGAGKAYFSCRFPNTAGVLSIEFDLRCNDKNKFLLGFYIEKDEDFQQSVHTKILRSESQTAPTIHIHGEPAPYMLGSWAHIRYVIDLNAGQVDGYIDGTRIAKGLRLPQSPKYLNTLAIRDNINTTGELWIGNIKVEKIG